MADRNSCTYNGISFETLEIKSIVADAVYDEGDQSVSHTRHVISVAGTLTAPDPTGLAGLMRQARINLMVPRADFELKMDDVVVFDITAPDDMGGPKPRRLEINEQVGTSFAMIYFELEVNLLEPPDGASANNIISHRYSVTHALDSKFATVRTIRGTILVREPASPNNPDALRGTVTPQIPNGFKRESMTFVVTEDGQKLEYEIQDKEVYLTAPPPASRAAGTFAIQLNWGGSSLSWLKMFQLELEAPKDVKKIDLFNAAMIIAQSRVDLTSSLVTGTQLVRLFSVEESLFENIIRLNIVKEVFIGTDNLLPATETGLFADVPLTDSNESPDYGPYGTAMIGAAKQVFYRPYGDAAGPAGAAGMSGTSSGPAVNTGSKAPGSGVNTSGTGITNPDQANHPYLHYEETINFQQHDGLVMLPSTLQLVPAKVYQLHNPYVILIQEGFAQRQDAMVKVPPPNFGVTLGGSASKAYVADRSVTPHAPTSAGDGKTFIYAVNWRYVILIPLVNGLASVGQYVDILEANPVIPIPANATLTAVPVTSVEVDGWKLESP